MNNHEEKYLKYIKKNIILGGKLDFFEIVISDNYTENKRNFFSFIENLNKKNKKKFLLKISSYVFLCELGDFIYIFGSFSFEIKFKCWDQTKNFIVIKLLNIKINENDGDISEYINTNCDFKRFTTGNKLSNALFIKETIAKFLGILKIYIYDEAYFSCNNDQIHKYNAIIYRILGTDKIYDEISIYNKYGYKYTKNKNESLFLEVRNYNKNKFTQELQNQLSTQNFNNEYVNTTIELIELLNNDNESNTVHDFFRKLNMNEKCINNYKFFDIIEKIMNFNYLQEKERNFFTMIKKLKKILNYGEKIL